jgi:hypothetical protein
MLARGAPAAATAETALVTSSGVVVAIVPTGRFKNDVSSWLASRLEDKL